MEPNPDVRLPEASAPTEVREELTTFDPKVVAFKTEVPLICSSLPVAKFKLLFTFTRPVVDPPSVKWLILVVARFPSPVKYVATLAVEPAMEAVGVPDKTF